MASDFYTQWLIVPAGPRPPNHYVLLGLPPFSSDSQAIEDAAPAPVGTPGSITRFIRTRRRATPASA